MLCKIAFSRMEAEALREDFPSVVEAVHELVDGYLCGRYVDVDLGDARLAQVADECGMSVEMLVRVAIGEFLEEWDDARNCHKSNCSCRV